VFLPAGFYRISSTLNITANGVRLLGASRGASVIRVANSTGHAVCLTGSFGGVSELSFETASGVARTQGAYISNNNGSAAGWFQIIANCVFTGGLDGISVSGGQDVFIENCNFLSVPGRCISAEQGHGNMYISRVEMTASPTARNGTGLFIGEVGGLFASQVDIFSKDYGIDIEPPSGKTATNIFLDQVQCDNCKYDGLSAASGFVSPVGAVTGLFVSNSWFQGNDVMGFRIGYYAKVSGVQLNGCQIFNNGAAGIGLDANASQVAITGCLIAANSRIPAGSGVGIQVAAGVSDVAVSGCIIGPTAPYASPTTSWVQQYAIRFVGSVARVILSGNSMSNNSSGKYPSLPVGAIDIGSV
jgi:hypothetical protein